MERLCELGDYFCGFLEQRDEMFVELMDFGEVGLRGLDVGL